MADERTTREEEQRRKAYVAGQFNPDDPVQQNDPERLATIEAIRTQAGPGAVPPTSPLYTEDGHAHYEGIPQEPAPKAKNGDDKEGISAYASIEPRQGPTAQTTYPLVQPIAVAGMPATMVNWDADTFIVKTAAIGFARAVTRAGPDDRTVVVGGATGFAGVTYRDITLVPTAVNAADVYPVGWNAGVMFRGDIWVDVKEVVLVTDIPAYDTATGRWGKAGAGNTSVATAKYMRGGAAIGALAILRLP